ncbi:hypothetical protein ZTR_05222 [Talaromyces verruculosus]|nr:hypothetical protein ZTR_05222 [Talaromyces verruculosus]
MFGALYRNSMGGDENDEKENLLEGSKATIKSSKRKYQVLRFLFVTGVALNTIFGILGLLTFASFVQSGKPSYENGFDTDLEPAKDSIELVVKTFSGGVELDSNGNFVMDDGGHEFIGSPRPAVDEAWETLLGGLNLDFDEDEVVLKDSTFQWPESGNYFTGLDVYHTLHCLNRLRQAIYPDYYTNVFNHPSDPSRMNHIDKQSSAMQISRLCNGDLMGLK